MVQSTTLALVVLVMCWLFSFWSQSARASTFEGHASAPGTPATANTGLTRLASDVQGAGSLPDVTNRSRGSAPAHPGFQWTRIQDLKPDARATNRPVKDKWAVVIGIGTFVEQPLNNGLPMDRAAQDFAQYLMDPHFGRFQRDHVRLLTNAQATRQNIMATVGSPWLGRVAGPDDLIVVFLGTHGVPAPDQNTYLCTYNTALNNLYSTGISMQSLMQSLRQNVKSDRIVLVLQACYSGAAELQSGAKALLFKGFNIDLERLALGKGYIILSSSQPDQITWGDVFSSNLIKALKQENGLIPLQQAFGIARDSTDYDTTHNCVGCTPQTPVMKSDWKGTDIVLGTPPIEQIKNLPAGAVNYLAAEAHYMKASQLVSNENIDTAIQEYQEAIKVDPRYSDAYNDYGSALAIKGDWERAARQFKAAIDLQPSDGLYRYNYARALSSIGQADESQKQLELAYGLTPKDRMVLAALADRATKSGALSKAANYLREALELYPGAASLHDRLSYVLTQKGDLSEALNEARQAVNMDASSISARLNMGSVLLLQGDYDRSASAYRDAIKLAPDNADAHYLLSSTLQAAGDYAGARAELLAFLERCSADNPLTERARQRLAELSGRRDMRH